MIYTPFDDADLSAIVAGPGDTINLRGGATYSAGAFPSTLMSHDNITIGMTGTGARPIISAGVVHSTWTYDAVNNVYVSPPFSGNFLGNVTEDGVPMKFISWVRNPAAEFNGVSATDHAHHLTYAASRMTAGQSLPAWSGSMTMNPYTNILYIRPSAGTPAEHVYIVSGQGGINNCGLFSSVATRGLKLKDLSVRHVSRHGIYLLRKIDLLIHNVEMKFIGGAKPNPAPYPTGLYMGNGLELSVGVHGARIIKCEATDIFDTAMTTQLYEGSPAQISDHHYLKNVVRRYGMHGIECSVQTPNQLITDVSINGLIASEGGIHSWAGERDGAAVTCLSNAVNSSRVTKVFATGVQATKQRRLYLGLRHGGVCGIENSTATQTYHQSPTGTADGATGQINLLGQNVSDNLGAPNGGNWTSVTAKLSRHFSPMML